jgi:hypothetical protein
MLSRRPVIRPHPRRLRRRPVAAGVHLFGDGAEYRYTAGAIASTGRGRGSGLRSAPPARLMRHHPHWRTIPVISAPLNRQRKYSPKGAGTGRHFRRAPRPPRPRDAHARAQRNRPRDDEPCRRIENAAPGGERRSHSVRSARQAANQVTITHPTPELSIKLLIGGDDEHADRPRRCAIRRPEARAHSGTETKTTAGKASPAVARRAPPI